MQPNEQQPVDYPEQTPPIQPTMPQSPPVQMPSVQPEPALPAQQPPVETQPSLAPIQPISDSEEQDGPTQLPDIEPVSWQAIEYIQHDKPPLWYVGFVVVALALVVVAVLLQAWTFVALIIVAAVALLVYSHRPPRMLSYVWSSKGLFINDQLHPLGEFKSFGVIQDTEHNQLMLIPIKRFRPGLAVFFPAEVGEQLVDIVGAYLPMQELHLDAFDKIIHKLRI